MNSVPWGTEGRGQCFYVFWHIYHKWHVTLVLSKATGVVRVLTIWHFRWSLAAFILDSYKNGLLSTAWASVFKRNQNDQCGNKVQAQTKVFFKNKQTEVVKAVIAQLPTQVSSFPQAGRLFGLSHTWIHIQTTRDVKGTVHPKIKNIFSSYL